MVGKVSNDCVVSYHHNIHTCGVARFNRRLADHIGVPMVFVSEVRTRRFLNPIVSVKSSEMVRGEQDDFLHQLVDVNYDLLIHDYQSTDFENQLLTRATRAMALTAELASRAREVRPDVISGFAVASYTASPSQFDPDLRMITFGMAHKIQSSGYQRVGELLSRTGLTFVLEISSALHEGTQFDDSFFEVGEEISECFQGNVDFLGFLADQEVVRRLARASAMLAFFPRGARENNTSIISAMNLGVPVITNLDNWSPSWMVHGETVFDINQLHDFPTSESLLKVGNSGMEAVKGLTFEQLLDLLKQDQE